MDKELIFKKVSNILQEKMYYSRDITLESSFVKDLDLDSLDLVEIIIQIEDDFGIDLLDVEVEKMEKVYEIVNYIHGKLGGK